MRSEGAPTLCLVVIGLLVRVGAEGVGVGVGVARVFAIVGAKVGADLMRSTLPLLLLLLFRSLSFGVLVAVSLASVWLGGRGGVRVGGVVGVAVDVRSGVCVCVFVRVVLSEEGVGEGVGVRVRVRVGVEEITTSTPSAPTPTTSLMGVEEGVVGVRNR